MKSQKLFRRKSSDAQYLHLIRASAGSGKTHRLTGDYLRLLFSTPNAYKHILAVTFTNKATEEMKSRIIKELYALSAGEDSGYLTELSSAFDLPEAQVRQKSLLILNTILHDYSSFSINTIDKFFQQTMRAFTREIGLSGGYNVEVDDTSYLPKVIDSMLFELDKPENKTLAQWLLAFMKDKIQDDKGWSIKKDVQKLANEIFNENYKTLSQHEKNKIHDKKHLSDYKKSIEKIVRDFENELKSIGSTAVNIMEKFGLRYDDFPYKKTSGFSAFVKWTNGSTDEPGARFFNLEDNLSAWITKDASSVKRSSIESAFIELNTQIKRAVAHFKSSTFYYSAKCVLNYFYTLGILNDVQNRMAQLQQDENILFLSDTTELLNKIIADNDSPFIYEKTGSRLENYMIDEFQDTSAMQWKNFKPLIAESLAKNNANLIVGDVKQSIYRWRNSDWRLMEEKITTDSELKNRIEEDSLDTNWRSDANIVLFNNAFFDLASQFLQNDYNVVMEEVADVNFSNYAKNKINEVYSQAYQHISPKKTKNSGNVDITFLSNEKDDDWKTEALNKLPKQLEQLQDEGFQLKDIAILVRRNHEAIAVAETLLKYKEENPASLYRYDIISNEALVIANAQSVKAVIALLRWFKNRNDETKKMLAVYEFYRFHRKILPDEALQSLLGKTEIDFPDNIGAELDAISYLPFYEMIEAFFSISKNVLDEKENAYVQAFLDIALKSNTGSSSDINNFLNWWDEKGYKKTLFSSDEQDAIRLVTIHKSKGLGFGAVIMPFAEWELDHKPFHDNIIWCRPTEEPFNALSIVPLRYGKNLLNTIFWKDYLEEKLFTYIDNLNLLYVAFTRAKHCLIAFTPKPKKQEEIKNVSDLLWVSIGKSNTISYTRDLPFIELSEYFRENDEETFFSLGNTKIIAKKKNTTQEKQTKTAQWQSVPFDNRLKLRFNSIGYFSNNGKRDYGILMHDIISRVETIGNISQAVERKILSGELSAYEKENIISELTNLLSISEVSDWYSGKYTVLNEMQMLHPRFGFSRPDRVMLGENKAIVVDYKFGEAEDGKYIRQVQHYVKKIREMGYDDVEGFVFYVRMGKVVNLS